MFRHAHRRPVVLLCAVLAAAALAAVPALAAVVKYDSKVTISSRSPAFHGHVKSENHACEVQRKVKLYKQRPGDNKLLGKDTTGGAGRWEVEVDPLKSGAYFAKVTRREEGTAGTTFVCRRDRSETVVID
jgi:hypothetical protein